MDAESKKLYLRIINNQEERIKILESKIVRLENRLKPKPKGSAKKIFEEFYKEATSDRCSIKTLASLAFDAGHALRHKKEDK